MAKHVAHRVDDEWAARGYIAYEYRGHRIEKQHYADGPSLFEWVTTDSGGSWVSTDNRLSDAKRAVDTALDEQQQEGS